MEVTFNMYHIPYKKVLSDVADVRGTVRYSHSSLFTAGSMSLKTLQVFMASQMVCTDVTFTTGVPFLITSCRTNVGKELVRSDTIFEARYCQLLLHQLAVITALLAQSSLNREEIRIKSWSCTAAL